MIDRATMGYHGVRRGWQAASARAAAHQGSGHSHHHTTCDHPPAQPQHQHHGHHLEGCSPGLHPHCIPESVPGSTVCLRAAWAQTGARDGTPGTGLRLCSAARLLLRCLGRGPTWTEPSAETARPPGCWCSQLPALQGTPVSTSVLCKHAPSVELRDPGQVAPSQAEGCPPAQL